MWIICFDVLSLLQIIIPQKQVGRNSDIYVTMVSYTTQVSSHLAKKKRYLINYIHFLCLPQVASKGWFVAMVATTVETANPEAEIQPGLNLLGPIKQKFLQVSFVFSFNSRTFWTSYILLWPIKQKF